MTLVDIIGGGGSSGEQLPIHSWMALLFWAATDPVNMPPSKARSIIETHLGRTLTGPELAEVSVMQSLDPRQLERAFMLMETGWITREEAKILLGL